MKKADACKGFTFVELVVVIMILSVIMGVCIPLFRQIGIMTAKEQGAKDLARRIQGLKETAVARSTDFYLHINPQSGLVYVTDETMEEAEKIEAAEKNGTYYNGSVDILNLEYPGRTNPVRQSRVLLFSAGGYSDRVLVHLREKGGQVTLKVGMFDTRVRLFDRYLSYDDCI